MWHAVAHDAEMVRMWMPVENKLHRGTENSTIYTRGPKINLEQDVFQAEKGFGLQDIDLSRQYYKTLFAPGDAAARY